MQILSGNVTPHRSELSGRAKDGWGLWNWSIGLLSGLTTSNLANINVLGYHLCRRMHMRECVLQKRHSTEKISRKHGRKLPRSLGKRRMCGCRTKENHVSQEGDEKLNWQRVNQERRWRSSWAEIDKLHLTFSRTFSDAYLICLSQ